jgi:hypothetical protein
LQWARAWVGVKIPWSAGRPPVRVHFACVHIALLRLILAFKDNTVICMRLRRVSSG